MSTTAPALISVEDYLRRTEKPNCEYIDGAIYPKPMPTSLHSLIQSMLVLLLSRQGVRALTELTLRLGPTKYLIPDVTVVSKVEIPYPVEPALLCAEILSPTDHLGAMLAKCEQYHEWGVPFCWVVDPAKRSAWEYHAGGEPARLDASGVLRAGTLQVELAELFAEIPSEG